MKLLSMLVVPAMLSLPVTLPTTSSPATATAVQDEGAQEISRGNVTKIDAAAKSFNINSGAEGAKDVIVTWNDATVFMLDGKIVKWDEIVKERSNLTVTHKKGVAIKVEGVSKK